MERIQWFPGHMAKAMREMDKIKGLCDGVVVVLDARAPAATLNKNLKTVFGEKPVLYILNKSDLADGAETLAFLRLLQAKGRRAISLCATKGAKRQVVSQLEAIVKEKKERAAQKGINRTFRFMVAGIPNTGKSTVINLLNGTKKAATGDKAGVTRQLKWIHCSSFDLLDTPGTMPPSCEDQTLARHLAYIGSINDVILRTDEIAEELLKELAASYPDRLAARYGIGDFSSPAAMLDAVCRRRGFLRRGGEEIDWERGAAALINDFRSGKLGQITLEKAADYAGLPF